MARAFSAPLDAFADTLRRYALRITSYVDAEEWQNGFLSRATPCTVARRHGGRVVAKQGGLRAMKVLRQAVWLLAMAGAVGAGGDAQAQPSSSREAARTRYREAQRLIAAQQWREALPLLREVAKTAETASVRYSIALCEENLGLWREALDDYRAALERANDPVLDPGLKPATRKLLQKEGRQSIEALSEKVPVVRVDRLPEGDAEIGYKLDGQPVEPNELLQGLLVNPGEHRLRAEARGRRALEVAFRMEERSRIVVALPGRLESLEVAPPAPAALVAPAPAAEPGAGGFRSGAGWVGVGVGAALVGAGVVASLRVDAIGRRQGDDPTLQAYGAIAELSGYKSRCDAADAGLAFGVDGSRAVASPARVGRLCSAQATFKALQYVFYGAGAVFAGAGAYLLLTPEPGASRARSSAGGIQVWALPGLGPATLGGSVGGVF
jgi:tetratricopeptide (TPR) repeat protein